MNVSVVISIIGALIAAAALALTWRSSADAARSATASEASANEARRSNQLAADAQARSTESTDIRWEVGYDKARNTVFITNVGTDTAHHVQLVVDPLNLPDARRLSESLGQIAPQERLGVNVRPMAAAKEAEWRQMTAAPIGHLPNIGLSIRRTIRWESALGTPASQIDETVI